jgi:hypothetical protein
MPAPDMTPLPRTQDEVSKGVIELSIEQNPEDYYTAEVSVVW